MQVEIHLFGPFEVVNNGEPLRELTTGRLPALVAFLSLHPNHPIQRSQVAYQLWPDSSEEQALTNLRKAIHQLRHALPEVDKLLLADNRTMDLHTDGGLQVDVIEFEAALRKADQHRRSHSPEQEQAALEVALELYQGDLLASCYDDWILPVRERLFQCYLQASERLVTLLEERRCYPEAIARAQALLTADPLREETYRQLIRLHALRGDRAAALSVYHTCVTRLKNDLEVEPESQTQEIYERLLKGSFVSPEPAHPATYPLVGREAEWKQLLGAWQAAQAGLAKVAMLTGEAGIGKTRLAEDLLEWARKQGVFTGTAVCYAAEGQASFVPVTTWLRARPLPELDTVWKREAARVLPELLENDRSLAPPQPIRQGWQRQVFFDSLKRALFGHGGPLLLFLDNLQWCDRDTLDWLQYLLGSPASHRLLVVAGLRNEEVSPGDPAHSLLLALRQAGRLVEIELPRLDERQTSDLGASVLGSRLDESQARYLYAQTEGVPLFIVEMARSGLKGQIDLGSAAMGGSADALTPRMRAVLEWRLGRVSSPARALAQSAAVVGREFGVPLVASVSELDEVATVAALDELWQRRIVRQRDAETYDFSHDRLRDVALLDLSPVRFRWLHQRAAEWLEKHIDGQRSDLNARIAGHYEHAGNSKKAASYYHLAAQHAYQLYALQDALAYLDHSLALDPEGEDLAGLHEERGDIYTLLDQREKAKGAYVAALAQALPEDWMLRARIHRKILFCFSRYDPDLSSCSYQSAQAALANVDEHTPGYWDAWLELQLSWCWFAYWRQDVVEMNRLLELMSEPMRAHGTTVQQNQFTGMIMGLNIQRDRYYPDEKTINLMRHALAVAKTLDSPFELADGYFKLGFCTCLGGLLQESEQALKESLQIADKFGFEEYRFRNYVYLSLTQRRMGQEQAVRAKTEKLSQILSRVSSNPFYESHLYASKAWLAYRAGDRFEAHRWAEEASQVWQKGISFMFLQWPYLAVQYAMAVEDQYPEQAADIARQLLSPRLSRLEPEVETALTDALAAFKQLGSEGKGEQKAINLFRPALAAMRAVGYL